MRRLLAGEGGARERYAPAARIALDDDTPNIGAAFAGDGTFLAKFGWRPFERGAAFVRHRGLFVCG